MIVFQAVIYLFLLGAELNIREAIAGVTRLFVDFILNIGISFVALVFFITDFFIYKEIIEKNPELQEKLEASSYKGVFKTIAGKYLM